MKKPVPLFQSHALSSMQMWTIPYQTWFALLFWVGNRISARLASLMLWFGINIIFYVAGPVKCNFNVNKGTDDISTLLPSDHGHSGHDRPLNAQERVHSDVNVTTNCSKQENTS